MTVSAGLVPSPVLPRPRTPGGHAEPTRRLCFDALRLPAAAGLPLMARLPRTGPGRPGPALRAGPHVWLLIAEGAAEEVPGLLRWLDWGTLAGALGLLAVGDGARVPAPDPRGGHGPREAATWLRPPTPGREGGRDLPAMTIGARPDGAPDLVRLVDAAATECHRALLRRQPLAFS